MKGISLLPRDRSLGGRLSLHLALQTFVGLAAVSLLVFFTIRAHLIAREGRALDEMQSLVVHLVEEAAEAPRAEGIEHALRDQFAGREEARLELFDAAGRSWLTSGSTGAGDLAHHSLSLDERVRIRDFILPITDTMPASDRPFRARLSLVTARDDALLTRLASTLLAGVLIGTLGVSLAAIWRVRQELASVGRLVAQIDKLDAEQLGRSNRLDGVDQPSELQPLIKRFNELLERLDGSYRQMAAFNADVAHELNTPLATLIASNEIAARGNADLTAPEEELIGSNLEELQRLRGIVRDMLFLSTAERGAGARRRHVPSLANEVFDVLDYHEAALEEADLSASVIGEASAELDVALVRRAVSNLVSNATRHATSGTQFEVRIESCASEYRASSESDSTHLATARRSLSDMSGIEHVRLSVTNCGAGVAPEHLARLFERFYRVDEVSRSDSPASGTAAISDGDTTPSPRHGLGLSIVAAIARMHGGGPFASSEEGVTTIGFTLATPPSTQSSSIQ